MRLIGLTGGIASGKSTVTEMFRALGVPVIDADVIAREVVAPGQPALAEIAARFPGAVDPAGQLDRAALARRVFSSATERAALDAITHPRIRARVKEEREKLARAGAKLALYDAALLIENDLQRELDGVILVAAPKEAQLERLLRTRNMSPAEAAARIAAQLPLDAKRAHATWVIENDGTLENTRAQVEQVFRALSAGL